MGTKNGKYDVYRSVSPKDGDILPVTISDSSQKSSTIIFIQQAKIEQLPNAERLLIVWLDSLVEKQKSHLDMQVKLRNIFGYLKTFDQIESCEKYVRQVNGQYEKILFIVQGNLSNTSIPRLHDLPHIKYIYIYGKGKGTPNQQWASRYPKVRGIFTSSKQLIEQINGDQADT
ncbi:unnamed protein product [Didymodactylos carnosus]|uniref:Uncharacterized protein n=1 Tax=Didymodactylos carnosus TaxID=1234261 RepID=A0A815VID3_9BILA|nr:unnamed protein product [Didymodactylos carnosus]CAF4391727.1 unnamed protein product [Didymodactylos carnosus]